MKGLLSLKISIGPFLLGPVSRWKDMNMNTFLIGVSTDFPFDYITEHMSSVTSKRRRWCTPCSTSYPNELVTGGCASQISTTCISSATLGLHLLSWQSFRQFFDPWQEFSAVHVGTKTLWNGEALRVIMLRDVQLPEQGNTYFWGLIILDETTQSTFGRAKSPVQHVHVNLALLVFSFEPTSNF
jgi:hypothetical protein